MEQDVIRIRNKQANRPVRKAGKSALTGSLMIVLVAFAVCAGLYLLLDLLSPFAQPPVFWVAGMLHLAFIRQKARYEPSANEWFYSLVATVLILVLSGTAALFTADLSPLLVFACACAFLLPFTVSELWRMNLQIAYDGAKDWHPTTEITANYPTFYFNSSPLRFRIVQKNGFTTKTIRFNVSKEMSLGKIFYDLAKNKSETTGKQIVLTDGSKRYFRWIFFTPDWLILNRTLDPEKTIGENGLKENDVVYAQKILFEDIPALTNSRRKQIYYDNARL